MISPTLRDQEEYTALRATIRERGTARICVFVAGVAAWAALTLATTAIGPTPLATLLPLLVLASAFEGVYALHIGVERIGRYLQVFHEHQSPETAAWEQTAMAFGRPKGAAALDPLFTIPFALAALFNLTPALIVDPPPTTQELVFVAGSHAIFLLRIFAARHIASRQRTIDLARFTEIRGQKSGN